MLEALVAVTATTGLFALAKGIRGNHQYRVDPRLVVPRDERGDDLPCPWCYGPTYEEDTRCSGCGRSFG
ncbi:MAG TPA: hypothetical protein VJ950_04730 [Acidimicrobiia bacterium]|nr:hypothetical protein [Acidimicrobiia bacterium]